MWLLFHKQTSNPCRHIDVDDYGIHETPMTTNPRHQTKSSSTTHDGVDGAIDEDHETTIDAPPTVLDVANALRAIQSDMVVTIPVAESARNEAGELFDTFRNALTGGCTKRGVADVCAESRLPENTEATMESYVKNQMARVSPRMPYVSSEPVVKLVPREPASPRPRPHQRSRSPPSLSSIELDASPASRPHHVEPMSASIHPRVSGFASMDLMEEAGANRKFRNVVWTGNMQMVYMYLHENEEIGIESHDEDQFFFVVSGAIHVLCSGDDYVATSGWCVFIPGGSVHNIKAISSDAHLMTIYAPPHHPHGTAVDDNPNPVARSSASDDVAMATPVGETSTPMRRIVSGENETDEAAATAVARACPLLSSELVPPGDYRFEERFTSDEDDDNEAEVLSEMEGMSSLGSDFDQVDSDGIDVFGGDDDDDDAGACVGGSTAFHFGGVCANGGVKPPSRT